MRDNQVTHEGILQLGEVQIPCYVLKNGERILGSTEMQKAFGVDRGDPNQRSSGRLNEVLSSKGITRSFSEDDIASKFQPKEVFLGNRKRGGYTAEQLPEICDVLLKARDYAIENNLELSPRQQNAIKSADVLMRSLAKVGITALIDEATGYQYIREKDELQKILKAYIAEELLPWQKRFPDVFYKELFRLNGWNYTVNGIQKRPSVIGTWTNKLIYEQLPAGVLDELKKNTPKSESGNYTARFFQSLTPDTGHPHLTAQIQQVVTLFQLSDNMRHMWSQFEKLRIRQLRQLELPFNFDEKGHTKEPIYESDKLSDMNLKLKKALDYRPKDESPN